jgi:hypothetical protein
VRYLQYRTLEEQGTKENDIKDENNNNDRNANKPEQRDNPHHNESDNRRQTEQGHSQPNSQTNQQAPEQAPNPHNDAKESISVFTYEWEEDNFQSLWGVLPAIAPENLSWGETTATWKQNKRNRIIDRGGSLPPKLKPETNLFVDDDVKRIPSCNTKASADLAFKTGRRRDGIVRPTRTQRILTHPIPFEELYEEKEPDNEAEEETLERKAAPNKDPDKQITV